METVKSSLLKLRARLIRVGEAGERRDSTPEEASLGRLAFAAAHRIEVLIPKKEIAAADPNRE